MVLIPNAKIDTACIGVAGPIVNGDCETTNLPWKLTCNEISKRLKTSNVKLLNDLEAAAWGVLSLPESDFVLLNPNAKRQIGNSAVLAAGTGLGKQLFFTMVKNTTLSQTKVVIVILPPQTHSKLGYLNL